VPETPEAREIVEAAESPEARKASDGAVARFQARAAWRRHVTVPVPFAAYFDLVAALEARLANGTVQRWVDKSPGADIGCRDVVRYVARLREYAFVLGW
jgi:hypothetical protein